MKQLELVIYLPAWLSEDPGIYTRCARLPRPGILPPQFEIRPVCTTERVGGRKGSSQLIGVQIWRFSELFTEPVPEFEPAVAYLRACSSDCVDIGQR